MVFIWPYNSHVAASLSKYCLKCLMSESHCVCLWFSNITHVGMCLLTQLHWSACLVNHVLTGAQTVLQLGGSSLWRGGRTDRVRWVYMWGGGTGYRGPWRPGWWRIADFIPHLATSTTHRTGKTQASSSADSERSPLKEERGERDIDLSCTVHFHLIIL